MRIDIRGSGDKFRLDKREIIRCASFVLEEMGEEDSELSVLLVNNSYIKRLNKRYRKKNSDTDVLAFPVREGDGVFGDCPVLGDVVISVEKAISEARLRRRTLKKEVRLYLVHGILHLLGYSDERVSERKKMIARQKDILNKYEKAKTR